LLTEFAVRGDAESLEIMRRRFETANVYHESDFGFYDLFRIDGIDVLIRLLCREWNRIRDDETLWACNDEIKHAEETLGKETVQAALEKESLVNESVRLYLERLHRQETAIQARQADRENSKKPLPRLTELIDALNDDLPQKTDWTDDTFRNAFVQRRSLFLHSGHFYCKPTPKELEYALRQLLKATNPGKQLCLLAAFARETMPRLEPRLFSLFDSPLHLVRCGAATAFERMTDPLVRAKGLELIARAPDFNDWYLGIGLLEKNYQLEDEALLLRTLESIPADIDIHELHAIVMSLIDLVASNAEFSFDSIPLWVYENSPCPHCRRRSVEQMIERSIATKNLLEECLDDSYEMTREFAHKCLGNPPFAI
jgi:hypothetical protein